MTALLLIPSALIAEAVPFKDYKNIPLAERQKLIQSAPEALKRQYRQWDIIISWGGQVLRTQLTNTLVDSKGLGEILGLFRVQQMIWSRFVFQQDPNHFPVPSESPLVVAPAIRGEDHKREEEYQKDEWFVVNVTPTKKTKDLNERARVLLDKWIRILQSGEPKDPGKILSREDLDALDADAELIRKELRKCPLWSAEEAEEAFAAIPPQAVRETR